MQTVPPRGAEALPEGAALPDREVRRRAPLLSAGRARPGPRSPVGVPPAAAREAEGPALLPVAREAVPRLLPEGLPPAGRHGREPPAAARAPARQRAGAPRLRRLTSSVPPADRPRALARQRPAGGHPVLPGPPGGRDLDPCRVGGCRRGALGDGAHRRRPPVAPGGPRRPDREGASPA